MEGIDLPLFAFWEEFDCDKGAFCVPRQDLPGMIKSLISSHKPRF